VRISLLKQLINRLITLPFFWVAASLVLSAPASAMGLGGINVASALGQPLKAEIEIVAVSKADRPSLAARLASPDAYKSAGLEYPFGNNFRFQIESRADGEPYLIVSSAKSISDPFVTLLVELTWSSGKLSREYTFLLDPVGYVPQQPAQAPVQAVAPAVQAVVPAEEAVVPAEEAVVPAVPTAASGIPATPTETAAATEVPVAPTEAVTTAVALPEIVTTSEVPVEPAETAAASAVPAAQPETTAVPVDAEPVVQGGAVDVITTPENQEWVVVRRGDTMTELADQYKLADISLERMLVALYRVNVKEFDGKNMNRIRAGKILHLPRQEDVERVTQREAVKEIHAQAADWNAYRQKLASAATTSKESQSAQQDVAGKVSSSVADKAPVAKESAKEVLKLSKGEAPGDRVAPGAGGASASAQDKKNAAQEETIAKAKAVKEEKMRTAMLEKNIQDMKRLAELKAAGTTQPPVAADSKVAVVSPLAAASEVAAASAVKSAAVTKPKSKEAILEPSLVDQILGEPLYLAGGAAALLVFGGAGFMLKRRKKKSSIEVEDEEPGETSGDVVSESDYVAEPVKPSPDSGDFTRTVVTQAQDFSQEDNVDPISEADLFLNFGRDAQAEEILKEALKSTPNNHQIHLKLLGIYANRQDTDSFSAIAKELKDSGDEHAWQEAVEMGRKLEPGNPLYGGSGASPTKAPAAATESGLDFDSGSANKTVVMSAGDMAAQQQPTSMDFDLAAATPAAAAVSEPVATPNLDDLIFDVTGSHTSAPAAQPAASKPAAPADDGAMEFTMDFPVADAVKPAAVAPVSAGDFGGISLNLGDTAAPSGSGVENKSDQWQEVATKLDLAKAYQEMGDADGVREILAEVLNEGDAEQQETAKSMLKQLG
jgi:pilus assembly protein FimV